MRGQLAGDDSARHEQPIPRNKRLKQDEDEDAPAYVLEENNQTLSKAEYEALVNGRDDSNEQSADKADSTDAKPDDASAQRPKDQIGQATRKRKAVKVADDDQEEDKGSKTATVKTTKKPKKKAKAVKLSFED